MESHGRPSCTKSEIEVMLRDFMQGAMEARGERSGQCRMKIEEWNMQYYQPTFWWFDNIAGDSAIFKSVNTSSPISLDDFSVWLDSQTEFNFAIMCNTNTRDKDNTLNAVVSEDMPTSKKGFYPASVLTAATNSFYKYIKAQSKTSDCICDFSKNFKIFLVDLMKSKEEGKVGRCSATFTKKSYYNPFVAKVQWADISKGDMVDFVTKKNT